MSKRNLQNRIYRLLQKNHLLSATDILALITSENISYNKTSVYRALEQMTEKGLVCQHNFHKSKTLYELQDDHHAHMICKECENIFSVECNYEQPTKVDNFRVDHHHLTLIGTCKNCI